MESKNSSYAGGCLGFIAVIAAIVYAAANDFWDIKLLKYTFIIGGILLALLAIIIIIGVVLASRDNGNVDVSTASTTRIGGAKKSTGLTKNADKRKKIVQSFNEKYTLCLQEEDIEKIVDASYVCYEWEKEIYDMDKPYGRPSEWYNGNTYWLRAYLKAFAVQEVSSDFKVQEKICLDSFAQIFDETDISGYASVDSYIRYINNKYLAFFDDTSLHMALKFLESKGKRYELPDTMIVKNESDMDRLMRKYDEDKAKADEAKQMIR